MNDSYQTSNSVDARIAVMEAQIQAFNTRLNVVSDRAYGLTGSMEGVLSVLREAREQRTDLLNRVANVQETLADIDNANGRLSVEVATHVRLCEIRSSRIEKLAWIGFSSILTVLGFLATAYFAKLGFA